MCLISNRMTLLCDELWHNLSKLNSLTPVSDHLDHLDPEVDRWARNGVVLALCRLSRGGGCSSGLHLRVRILLRINSG